MDLFKLQNLKIFLLFTVFVLFLGSAVGLMEFNLISGIHISVNSYILQNTSVLFGRLVSPDYLLFIFIGLVLSAMLPVFAPLRAGLLILVTIPAVFIHSYLSVTSYLLIPVEFFLLMILMLYVINILISYFLEIHARQKIFDSLGLYVPTHIIDKIRKGHVSLSLDGEAKVLTVLFCDIQDFTSIAEQLNPKQVTSLLNEYFTVLSKIIFSHNGTIDKFMGDAIMAFWGAPYEQNDHAQKAVMAAMEMEKAVSELSNEFTKRGWPGPKTGFGINTGLMSVGNMGSVYRMAYTVIGDAVNIAARIETLTRTWDVPIIVTESTMLECNEILFRELDIVILRGKHRQIRIYQPLCLKENADENLLKHLNTHKEGLSCYYNKQWGRAKEIFEELSGLDSDDQYYIRILDKITRASQAQDSGYSSGKNGEMDLEMTVERRSKY